MVSVASNERDLGVQYSSQHSGGDIAVLKYQNNHHWASNKNSSQRYSLPPSKHQHKSIDAGVTVNSKLPSHRKLIQYPKTSPRNHLSVPLPSYSRERPPSGGSHHFDSIKSVATNTFSSFLSGSPGAVIANNSFANPAGNSNAVRVLNKQGSTLLQQPEIRYRPMSLVKSVEAKSVLNDLNAIAAASQKSRSKSLISLPKGVTRDNRDSSVPAGHRNGHGQRHRIPATNPNQNAYPVSSIPNEKSRVVLDKSFAILNSKQRHASSKDRHAIPRIKSARQLRSMVRETPAASSGSGEINTNGGRSPIRKAMSTFQTGGSPYSNGVKARNNAIERNASKIASAVKNSAGERAKIRGKSAKQPKMRLVKTIEDTTESLSNCKM